MVKKINPIEYLGRGLMPANGPTTAQRHGVDAWMEGASPEELRKALKLAFLQLGPSARAATRLYTEAHTDALTGIGNLRHFVENVTKDIEFIQLSDASGRAIVFIDLVGLSKINKMGQGAGDAAIKAVADKLSTSVRGNELCARIGGDEFACLVVDNEAQADFAEKIVGRFNQDFEGLTFEYDGKEYPVQIYTAVFPVDPALSAMENIRIAGEMLAEAKKAAGVGREFDQAVNSDFSGNGASLPPESAISGP
jgi:diguanylate cyclase (GGDEF)-like protein